MRMEEQHHNNIHDEQFSPCLYDTKALPLQTQPQNNAIQEAPYEQPPAKQYPNSVPLEIQDDQQSQTDSRWYAKQDGYKPMNAEQRTGFIRKVYSIIIIQLAITTFMCILSYAVIEFRQFQLDNPGWVYLALGLAIAIEILLFCAPKFSWKVPQNYLFLLLFTLCESYLISQLCSYVFNKYSEDGALIVLMAAALTLAAVVGITIYACRTKKDFTVKGAFLFMCCTSLILFGLMSGIYYNQAGNLLYSLLWCLLFGVYLIYDTQLIIGGSTHKLSIDDYIIGAMIIYIDIIYLFANIIMIIISCIR